MSDVDQGAYPGAMTNEQAQELSAEVAGALRKAMGLDYTPPFALLFAVPVEIDAEKVLAVQSVSNVPVGPLAKAILKIAGPHEPAPDVGFMRTLRGQ